MNHEAKKDEIVETLNMIHTFYEGMPNYMSSTLDRLTCVIMKFRSVMEF